MGATTWHYFTRYQADIGAALQSLRQQVFREDDYGSGIPEPNDMRAVLEELVAQSPNAGLARQQMEEAVARLEQLRRMMPSEPTKAATIEELLEQRAENGTHSILDVLQVSNVPTFGAVSRMPSEELVKLFGTDKPTRRMVEGKLGDYDLVEHPLVSERWQGIYFIVYRDAEPDELYFMGTSGD